MTWAIRPATPADADAVRAVAVAAWRDTYEGLLRRETIETFLERAYGRRSVTMRIERGGVRVAVGPDGAIVAYAEAIAAPDRVDLVAIYARPDARGSGVGTLLLDDVRSRHPGLPIAADVLDGNRKGEVFYERRGFLPGERQEVDLLGEPIVERRWWLGRPPDPVD